MDRRSFVAMLGSIPFVNKLTMEALPEKEIEKIEALDEATLLVIRKAQALTDGFLTGFKNVKFELVTNIGKFPLEIKNYNIENGVARIQLNSVKIEKPLQFQTIVATYNDKFIFGTYDVSNQSYHPVFSNMTVTKGDEVTFNVTLSIAC